jgi:Zn-dependent alcohol dehydrogenase
MQFGRCNVRQFIPLAAKVLQQNQELFSGFITHRVRLDQAAEYYALFNDGKVGKTVFVADDLPLERS